MTTPRRDPPEERAKTAVQISATARDQGKNYTAGRDVTHNETNNYGPTLPGSDPFHALVTGPGRLIILVGLVIVGFSFAGWASIVMNQCGAIGPDSMLGPRLPSGIRIGAVYFLSFGLGGIIVSIGGAMAKSRGAHPILRWIMHLITALAIIAVLFVSLSKVLGGDPLSALYPNFGTCKAS